MPSAPDLPVIKEELASNQGLARPSFWRTLTRLELDKVVPGRAARNAIGVAVPLAAGYLFGSMSAGLVVSSGALNVCFTDGDDPYLPRARRMLLGTLLVGLAVLTGTLSGHDPMTSIAITGDLGFRGWHVGGDQSSGNRHGHHHAGDADRLFGSAAGPASCGGGRTARRGRRVVSNAARARLVAGATI